jgi:hypothetical protein
MTAVIISIAAALSGCGASKQEAGVHVGLAGDPTPIALAVDAGKCRPAGRRTSSSPSAYECTVPQGRRTFTARCANSMPEAVLVIEARRGTSNFAQFNDVCSLRPKRRPGAGRTTAPGS